MLNALAPGTVMPIRRHRTTSEMVICLWEHFEECFYDEYGNLTDTFDIGSRWLGHQHRRVVNSLKSLESGTVLFEAKDVAFADTGKGLLPSKEKAGQWRLNNRSASVSISFKLV